MFINRYFYIIQRLIFIFHRCQLIDKLLFMLLLYLYKVHHPHYLTLSFHIEGMFGCGVNGLQHTVTNIDRYMRDLIGGVDKGTDNFLVGDFASFLIGRQNHVTGLNALDCYQTGCSCDYRIFSYPDIFSYISALRNHTNVGNKRRSPDGLRRRVLLS